MSMTVAPTCARETAQTSPRFCFGIRRLRLVVFNEKCVSNFRECLIRQGWNIQQSYLLYDFRDDGLFSISGSWLNAFQDAL